MNPESGIIIMIFWFLVVFDEHESTIHPVSMDAVTSGLQRYRIAILGRTSKKRAGNLLFGLGAWVVVVKAPNTSSSSESPVWPVFSLRRLVRDRYEIH